MHPDTHWLIYHVEATVRQHQHRQRHHLLDYPRLPDRIAFWSGSHLLHWAQWLLRYGQQSEQWRLGMQGTAQQTRTWGR